MDIKKYPEDGGDSGALILDGKQEIFNKAYLLLLTDLPDAFQKHIKQYAKWRITIFWFDVNDSYHQYKSFKRPERRRR